MNLGEPIATGNTAKIYLNDHKIFKIYKDYLPPTESAMEAAKQRFAHSCGLPVPKVIEITKVNNNQVLIMEYIKGKTLGDLLFENLEMAEYYMSKSIDIQQQIHHHEGNDLQPITAKWRRQIEGSHILEVETKSLILAKLKLMPNETRLCHGDYHLFNLVQADDKVWIIDWVDAGAGDVRADICRTYLLYLENHQELADLYLNIYCSKTGDTKEAILEWMPIIAAARLSENDSPANKDKLLKIINRYIG
ncbi:MULTISPECIES: phosphotransferase family protein [Bacillaceae]|uniref:Phosphotransferase n=1 Tax=Niallia hominis TaxID=3133173 RepID=A0ABV1F7Q7_9BACI|nr:MULTISPECIES: phosphotransferase [Bacillaceae]MCM3361222.1 aminoglycoside phosphotransferase family protein [Niallia sp. MER TA 168]CAI9395369.1 Thiamine kinase [Bacillus sp. T2.9-1]